MTGYSVGGAAGVFKIWKEEGHIDQKTSPRRPKTLNDEDCVRISTLIEENRDAMIVDITHLAGLNGLASVETVAPKAQELGYYEQYLEKGPARSSPGDQRQLETLELYARCWPESRYRSSA